MDRLPDDRIALVLFAGRAYMQMPLTTDHSAARMFVQQASPDVVPAQGTVLTEALRMSNTAFNSKERKFKSIILITDGEDHDPGAVPLAQQLAQDGVMINTVGVGSPEGSPILDPVTNDYKKDQAGNTVITKLNEPELQQLAAATKGVYIRLADTETAVDTMKKQLGTIEQTSMDDSAFKNFKNYFLWFLVEHCSCWYWNSSILNASGKPHEKAVIHISMFGRDGLLVQAQTENKTIRTANKLYKEGKYDKALPEYEKAIAQNPNNPVTHYNLGNAQFRKEDFPGSEKNFEDAASTATTNEFKQRSLYNKRGGFNQTEEVAGKH